MSLGEEGKVKKRGRMEGSLLVIGTAREDRKGTPKRQVVFLYWSRPKILSSIKLWSFVGNGKIFE